MIKEIRSVFRLVITFLDKGYNNISRMLAGIPPLKTCQVNTDLFLGSQYNLQELQKLKALGITAIINMRMHSALSEAQYKGFHYLHLPTPDNTAPPIEVLIRGADFAGTEIKKGGKVYIHCRQGLGRGPTMTIACLIKTGLSFENAFLLVKNRCPFINPRPVQLERLKELENYCREKQ